MATITGTGGVGKTRLARAIVVGRRARKADDLEVLGRLITALFRFEYFRRGVEFVGWAGDVVDHGRVESPYGPPLHAAAAVAAWRGGDLQRAKEVARAGTRLARIADDPDTEALGLVSLSLVRVYGRTATRPENMSTRQRQWRRRGRGSVRSCGTRRASAVGVQQAASAVFRSESTRLEEAMSTARRRLGSDRFRAAQEQGAAMTRQQVVDHALAAIARAAPR